MNSLSPGPAPGSSRPQEQPAAAGPPLLTLEEEGRAFWRMRRRLVTRVVVETLSAARFRLSLVILLSILLWAGVFLLLNQGFGFLRDTVRHRQELTIMLNTVFATFFGAMLAMLLFSSGIILYSSLFRSAEVTLLLTLPARDPRIFLHKFQEAMVLSSWGFLLLGSPMLLAYGVTFEAPWYYYAMLPALLLAFTHIPVSTGGIFCLLLARYAPGAGKYLLILLAAVLPPLAAWGAWWAIFGGESNPLTPAWWQDMTGRLAITQNRLLPSWWLSAGLLAAGRREWVESLKFLALMIANALFLRQLALAAAARMYRRAYGSVQGRPRPNRRARAGWIDRCLLRIMVPLLPQVRTMMTKDLRLFRRDPVQWSQLLIFVGLLLLYFINIRPFSYDVHYSPWVNMISLLNLLVVGLLMSTFTTRFVFPMPSLEGRRFWLLGLLPLRRETIIWSKFAFALACSVLPCSALILLSDSMLRVSLSILAVHQLTCLLLCLGLSSIAVGLGARLPNFREQSPSRIAAGFGGTLTLVLSALYILAVVLLTALPCHYYLYLTGEGSRPEQQAAVVHWLLIWVKCGAAGSVLLTLLAVVWPLHLGLRAFRRMEF